MLHSFLSPRSIHILIIILNRKEIFIHEIL
nr:MAG TPA: hypothetical protein [Caudoviricetes sp.]